MLIWRDSLVKRLDPHRFARKFTPRRNKSKWSDLNLKHVEKLKAAGLMTLAESAKVNPTATATIVAQKRPIEIPSCIREALARDDKARLFFDRLAPSYQSFFLTRTKHMGINILILFVIQ
ncbi:MAG: hypothetical protein HKM93_08850 [Desulfobacteraceae bacterium]|nr:hypothetical protein [Desulfobacteraceae bacterium]